MESLSNEERLKLQTLSGVERMRLYYAMAAARDSSIDTPLFELKEVYIPALASFVVSGSILGTIRAKQAGDGFIRRAEQEAYAHKVQAVRDWHSAQFRSFFKYGYRFGWRVSFLVTSIFATQSLFWIYTDHYTISHYSIGGTLAGAVYRMNMGLRGMFVGSILGAVMGTLSGSLQYLNHMHINKGREIKSAENRRHLFYLKHLDILK